MAPPLLDRLTQAQMLPPAFYHNYTQHFASINNLKQSLNQQSFTQTQVSKFTRPRHLFNALTFCDLVNILFFYFVLINQDSFYGKFSSKCTCALATASCVV